MDEVLFEAARVLDERGWTQGAYTGDGNSVCMMGALKQVLWGAADREPWGADINAEVKRTRKILRVIKGQGFLATSVPDFNDHCATTKEECVKILMEAAELEGAG